MATSNEQQLVDQLLQRICEGYYEVEIEHAPLQQISILSYYTPRTTIIFSKSGKTIFSVYKATDYLVGVDGSPDLVRSYCADPYQLDKYAEQLYEAAIGDTSVYVQQSTVSVLHTILGVRPQIPDTLDRVDNFMDELMESCSPHEEFKCVYVFNPSIQEAGELGGLGWRQEKVYPNGIVLFVKISSAKATKFGI